MIEYPKIETLFTRGENHGVTDVFRKAEFYIIPKWIATEKVDGTNIRIQLFPDINALGIDTMPREVRVQGRTDKAQINPDLLDVLTATFTLERMWEVFHGDDAVGESPYIVTLYGEGYGPKIQKGGNYRDTPGFRLFDVKVGDKWLDWWNVESVALQLGIRTVPVFGFGLTFETEKIVDQVRNGFASVTADEDGGTGKEAEGIVARTVPTLFDWRGNRVMWKLKTKDFK